MVRTIHWGDVPIGPVRRVKDAAPRKRVSHKNFPAVIKWNEISP